MEAIYKAAVSLNAEPRLILRPDKKTQRGYVIATTLAIAVLGAAEVFGLIVAWPLTVFLSVCLAIFVVQMLPGAAGLVLTRDGFAIKSLYRSHLVRWSDIDEFRTGPNQRVIFRLSKEYAARLRSRPLGVLTCDEGRFRDSYGVPSERLAAFLNEWRQGTYRLDI